MDSLSYIRRRYAEEIRVTSNLRSKSLVEAFATVPRERFLGPGPWQIPRTECSLWQKLARPLLGSYRITPDNNPKHLYQNVLVAIDPSRNLNNGQPSGIAFWLDALGLRLADHVLHVGCGVGYYTAIIAEVVGAAGYVVGIEIDAALALRARENLAYFDHVEVVHGDGGAHILPPFDAIFINAGASHPRVVWLDSLKLGGRLILPLTTDEGRGGMLKVERWERGFMARFLSTVSVFPCSGSRDEESSRRLQEVLKLKPLRSVASLRREPHEIDNTCWLHGNSFCLSTIPVSKSGEV